MKKATTEPDARQQVSAMFEQAGRAQASDIHLEPSAAGYDVRFRVDGVLETVEHLDVAAGRAVVTRLMVMADLLTYRQDIPQEGRIPADMRLAIMPTTRGLRAVLRLSSLAHDNWTLSNLGLPFAVSEGLSQFARGDDGMILLTGPAGSGKTTAAYALLTHILATQPGLSVIALEDPVERDVPGVTQIQVQPFGDLTYERALRSILRQDPQVLMLGEIRDAATAAMAVQASLTGHRLVATLHAGTCGGAIARLLDMGIEPYQIISALRGVVAMRLLRRKQGETYAGRRVVAAMTTMSPPLRQAVLRHADAGELETILAGDPLFVPLRSVAMDLVRQGVTDEAEVRRVLGELSTTEPTPGQAGG
ncbi:MAG: Flp pilus assembly complex ATPase component TadA [Phycisphaeraceae bacterium]|nr:Flp pilus assembly complex ATPase component TadA [Phycisphaeraceae bacterium]